MGKLPKFDIGKSGIKIIQGGMGIGVFRYNAVRKVSRGGGLGVASGIGLEHFLTRELQMGDVSGDIQWALGEFPNQDVAARVSDTYFIRGGKVAGDKFKSVPFPRFEQAEDDSHVIKIANQRLEELLVVSNFAEIALAKRWHNNPVGINYLHKVQWPLLAYLYGAMLAGVDAILIGAGLPKEVPGVLDNFSEGMGVDVEIPVASDSKFRLSFDPTHIAGHIELDRPTFLGIVSNHLGAKALPNVDGYIVEGYSAGGHNAPARNKEFNDAGEPAYGSKDDMNFEVLQGILKRRGVCKPYFLGGGYAGKLNEALVLGANGVQISSPFAFSRESDLDPILRRKSLDVVMRSRRGDKLVYTDPRFSPSGFPFKILQVDGTLSSPSVVSERSAHCDFGYLSELYENGDGKIRLRCPAEPEASYLKKGGAMENREGRGCLCSGLISNVCKDSTEPRVVTAGSELEDIRGIVKRYGANYTIENVMEYVANR